jgi:tripartite ATP-independent transporter DctP family solute receptor
VGTCKIWPGTFKHYFMMMALIFLGILNGPLLNAFNDSTPAFGNTTVLLRLAHCVTANHPTHIVTEEIAKELYQKTGGRVRMEIYGNMQFGQEIELAKMIRKGKLDLAIVSLGVLFSFDPDSSILELPYLFSSEEQADQVLDGQPGQVILNSLTHNGLIGVCYWGNGFRSITTYNRQVWTPEDLLGIRIRVIQNPIDISFFSDIESIPTPMDWGDVVPALRGGIIEAQESPISVIYLNHLEKYQQYLILTEHIYDCYVVLASTKLQSKLNSGELQLVYSLFQNARFHQRRLIKELNEDYRVKLRESGMKIINPDIENFRRLGRDFSKKAVKDFEPRIRTYFERYLQ